MKYCPSSAGNLLRQDGLPCDRFSIRAWSMVATAIRQCMWRRCSKSAVCCSISENLRCCRRGGSDASTKSSSRTRISIISLDSTICFVCSSGTRNRCSCSVHPALPSASFTSFRPIAGIWSKPIPAILSSLSANSKRKTPSRLRGSTCGRPLQPSHQSLAKPLPACSASAAILEHGTSCLAFALQEAAHVNLWKNRLLERGLSVGPWLRSLKKAVVERRADDHLIPIDGAVTSDRLVPLGSLRDVLTVTAGQKIAYVTDVADTPANRAAIVALVQNADILFIEAAFARADAALASERAHLTTTAAGEIAREANVRRVEPFHFSPRYAADEAKMLAEVTAAFSGSQAYAKT